MRKALLALLAALLVMLPVAAAAQVCPAVAALPDTERRVTYSPSASSGPFSVTFSILGDSTDYGAWVEVWLNGARLTAVTDWQLTIPSGTLATACRPITNASITLTTPSTGTLEIVGARRPRRTSQFAENAGVSARNLNQVITDLTAQNRETWDKLNDVTGRALVSRPGNSLGILPAPASCASAFLGFDATGLQPQCLAGGAGSGNVVGPLTTTVGHLAVWNNTTGTLLADLAVNPVLTGGTNCSVASGTCLDNITGFAATGILSRTAAGTYAQRTLIAPAIGGFSIANIGGVAGNPTFSLTNDLLALESLAGTGFATRTTTDTWAQRTITGTANEVTVTNGDGVSGNPTISLPTALTFTGKTVTAGTFSGTPLIPVVTGGTGTTGTQLTLQTTTGAGTTDAMVFQRGNNGGTLAGTLNNTGWGFGPVAPNTFFNFTANATTVAPVFGSASISPWIFTGVDGSSAYQLVYAYGTAAQPGLITFNARGTAGSPSALQSGDLLGGFGMGGYGTSQFSAGTRVLFTGVATETWSNTANGSALDFRTTANTGVTTTNKMRVHGSGCVSIGNTTDCGANNVNATGNITANATMSAGANGGTVGSVKLFGSTSGDVTVKAAAVAGTATNFQLPAANGTSGQLLSSDGSGNTSWITASGTGTVTSVVCGTVTITAAGTCDNGVLLETVTASASASITGSVTFSGTYNRYQLVFDAILPATNAAGCRLRVNSGGVQTTTYLASALAVSNTATAISAPTTFITCSRADTADVSNAGQGISGEVWVSNPSQTASPKNIRGWFIYPSTASTIINMSGGGWWNGGNGAVTNWQVDFTTGNIASGTVKVYGWK